MTQMPFSFSLKFQFSISWVINHSVSIPLPAVLREVLAAFLDNRWQHPTHNATVTADIVLRGPGTARADLKLTAGDVGVGNMHVEGREKRAELPRFSIWPQWPISPSLGDTTYSRCSPNLQGWGERSTPSSYTTPEPAVHTSETKQPSPAAS